jgi:hypothetical protein
LAANADPNGAKHPTRTPNASQPLNGRARFQLFFFPISITPVSGLAARPYPSRHRSPLFDDGPCLHFDAEGGRTLGAVVSAKLILVLH